MAPHPAIFVNGTVGVGKSTVLDHLGDLCEEAGQPFTLVDLDALRRSWPPPREDPFNHQLELANLGSLRRNDLEPEERLVLLAGVIEDRAARPRYERVLGTGMVVVRLVARGEVVRARLDGRYPEPARERHRLWHQARAVELARVLDAAALDDHVIDVSDLPARQAASAVLRLVGPTS